MTATRLDLPTGTVTFLRTDVEGSMQLARSLARGWDELNDRQAAIVRRAVEAYGGIAVRTEGDAVFAVFPEAVAAARAAIDVQRDLAEHAWPPEADVRVRVGLHTGEAHLAGDDYGGFDVNRAARIAAVGHGGQIVVSDATRALIEAELPVGVGLRDLGRHVLRDVPQPERLFQLEVPGLRADFPPLRTASGPTGNLPPRLTSFVARESELRELEALLDAGRLVTITGPGGIGKTSLAIELARERAVDYPDGAWLVALDAVADADQVLSALARTFGIYDGPGRPIAEGLVSHLADRRALVVLDNFEHVLDAAPDVGRLLLAAADVRFVVTSRAPLRVAGEQEYPVRTLAGADGTAAVGLSPAALLFAERARAVAPGWSPAGDAGVVEEICRLVDGLPLGIELAAARMNLLPPGAIRDRLKAHLPLPGSGPRDAPARQRTLEATIAWSFDLLAPGLRQVLTELAVFEESFDLDQARAVASPGPSTDLLDVAVELAERNLIARAAMGGHSGLGTVRFRMLETIRAFGLEQLRTSDELDDVRRRHAVAMLELAERAAPHLPGGDQGRWLDRLAEDHANLGAAIRSAVELGDVDVAQRLSAATWRYWQLGGHLREGRALADSVVDMPRADEPSPGRMWSFMAAGGLAYWQADTVRASALYHLQLETAGQIGHRAGEADACFNLTATEFIGGDRAEADVYLDRAIELYRQLGDQTALARTDWSKANIGITNGDALGAIRALEKARAGYKASGDAMYDALAAGSIAFSHIILGRPVEALRVGVEALTIAHALRDVSTTTITLAGAAIIFLESGLNEEAATAMGAFENLCEVHGVRPPAGIGMFIASSNLEERAYASLTADQHAAAVRRGKAMSLDEAVTYVVNVIERALAQVPEA